MSCDCEKIAPIYRIVQTISERNSIPCIERTIGMVVRVVQENFTDYTLKSDMCKNTGWEKSDMNLADLRDKIGHYTEDVYRGNEDDITKAYLNTKYPKVQEGFRVYIVPLNTTFEKINGDDWKYYGTFKLDK